MTHQVAFGSPLMSIDEPTTAKVMIEPTERSKPPETMTIDLSGGEDRERRGALEEVHVAGRLEEMRR